MIARSLVLALVLVSSTVAQERGTVVSVRTTSSDQYIPANPSVPASTAIVVAHRVYIYRVEAERKVYELEDWWTLKHREPTFSVGDAVEFRVQKNNAVIRTAGKEHKYRIIAEELKK